MTMSPLARRLIWDLALVGLGASLTSLYVHYQLLANPSYTSFCDVSSTVSCTQAYLSRYGSIWGIPVALPGALWFGLILVLSYVEVAGPPTVRETVPSYVFVLSTIGLAIILYLGYAAFFVLKVVCLLCLTTYAAVIGLFIVSGLTSSLPMTSVPRRIIGDLRALVARPAVLAVVVLFLAGAVSSLAFFPKEGTLRAVAQQQGEAQTATADQRSEFERWYTSQPRLTVPVPADGAAVVIVKFTDIQCPTCGTTYFSDKPVISKYQAQYPGAVKYVAKDYPLQPECNPNVPRPVHLASCDAAVAIRLARQAGKGTQLEEWFYANQSSLSPASVRQAAQTIGGVQNFDAQYAKAIEGVRADVSLGQTLNVRVTPTFFINGVKVDGGLAPQYMDMAIAYELKRAGRIK
jgi:uncharacterized membrane protein/protein-disulfide isomerase